MVKMTLLVNKVWTYMKEHVTFFAGFIPTVDVKAVKAKAKAYWFRDRQNTHATPSLLQDLWHESFTQIKQLQGNLSRKDVVPIRGSVGYVP